jgi:hypothetical protein
VKRKGESYDSTNRIEKEVQIASLDKYLEQSGRTEKNYISLYFIVETEGKRLE